MPSIHKTATCLYIWGLLICTAGCRENDSSVTHQEPKNESGMGISLLDSSAEMQVTNQPEEVVPERCLLPFEDVETIVILPYGKRNLEKEYSFYSEIQEVINQQCTPGIIESQKESVLIENACHPDHSYNGRLTIGIRHNPENNKTAFRILKKELDLQDAIIACTSRIQQQNIKSIVITQYNQPDTSDKEEFLDQIKRMASNAEITLNILDYNSPTFAHDTLLCDPNDPAKNRYSIGLYHPEDEEICLVNSNVDDLQSAISFWRNQLPSEDVDILVIARESGILNDNVHDEVHNVARNLNLNVVYCKRSCFQPHWVQHIKAKSRYPNLEPTEQLEIELGYMSQNRQHECRFDNKTMTFQAALEECRLRIAQHNLDSIVIIQTDKRMSDEYRKCLNDFETLAKQTGIAFTYIHTALSKLYTFSFCELDYNQNTISPYSLDPLLQHRDKKLPAPLLLTLHKPGLRITPDEVGALVFTYFENGSVHAGFLHRNAKQICYLNETFESLEACVMQWLQWIGNDSIDLIAISRVEDDGANRFMASIEKLASTLELDYTLIPYFPNNAVTVQHYESKEKETTFPYQETTVFEVYQSKGNGDIRNNDYHIRDPNSLIEHLEKDFSKGYLDPIVVINYDKDGHDYCEQIEKAVRQAGAQYTFIDASSSVDHLSPECAIIDEDE